MLLQHFNKRYDFDCSFIETFRKHSLVQLRFSVGPLETVRAFESFKATDFKICTLPEYILKFLSKIEQG